jgi:hypothetical protein
MSELIRALLVAALLLALAPVSPASAQTSCPNGSPLTTNGTSVTCMGAESTVGGGKLYYFCPRGT